MNTYEIEFGNAARATALHKYKGSDLGAVRRANALWKFRMGHETMLHVYRVVDGQRCRPLKALRALS